MRLHEFTDHDYSLPDIESGHPVRQVERAHPDDPKSHPKTPPKIKRAMPRNTK